MNSRSHQYYFTWTSPQQIFGEREVGVKIEFQDKSPVALEPAVIPSVQKETEKSYIDIKVTFGAFLICFHV